jgi:hypothetical protein
MEKYIILGSAPHMRKYWPKVRDYYIKNNYKICAINNAWVLERDNLYRLYLPDDFLKGAGTVIPNKNELATMNVVMMPRKVKGYFKSTGGTMSVNVMHLLKTEASEKNKQIKVVVIGSDYIYKKDKPTHFYGSSEPSKIVTKMIKKNNPKYDGLAADPLRFGTGWLKEELDIVAYRYLLDDSVILKDTPFEKESILPFKQISKKNMSLKLKYNISQWDSHKVNYWGITKSGNTSVKYGLLEACNKHLSEVKTSTVWVHDNKLAKYIDKTTAFANGNKNISVTRNPYDRTLSMYKDFAKRKDTIYKGLSKKFNINCLDDFLDFLLAHDVNRVNIHFKPQSYFITENGKLLVDLIIDIGQIKMIEKQFKIKMPHINNIPSNIELNKSQIAKINKIYVVDFELLNYKMK